MALLKNGFNGGFNGKVGKIVGSSWRDLDVIRSVPKRSNKPATQSQLDQRARFACVVRFLQPIKEILNIGFMNDQSGRATGYNMGLKDALNGSVTGSYPDYSLDYSLINLSRGGVAKPTQVVFDNPSPLEMVLTWSPGNNTANKLDTDKAVIVIYDTEDETYYFSINEVTRLNAMYALTLSAAEAGHHFHAWMFLVNAEGTRPSNSVYAGTLTLS